MKTLALATALAASIAAPAFAQDSTQFAIMHFNMSLDNAQEMRMVPSGEIMMADLGMGSTLGDVFSQLNLTAENMTELRGTGETVTVIASDPAHAAAIFERLMAADDDN
ncbi:hypothetical protein [Gymnodinialimonas hymeniacidonis]|uniref:hypothetical protein n=1 Tax=Gymnodinialimonas hymeniacidonis TaxID=3126508 RepID=UPI0034C6979D